MNNLYAVILPVVFLIFIVLIVYFTSKFKYQTNKAILEKGGSIESSKFKFPYLETGLTALGIGIGLGLAAIFNHLFPVQDTKDMMTGSFVMLFGGLGLVLAFFIRKKLEK